MQDFYLKVIEIFGVGFCSFSYVKHVDTSTFSGFLDMMHVEKEIENYQLSSGE